MLGTLRKQYELLEKKKAEIQAKQLKASAENATDSTITLLQTGKSPDNTIVPQSNLTQTQKIELTEEKLQNTLKQIPQENELENITQKYLKDIAEAKEVETKTQLTLEFLEKKHEHLIREKYEFLDAIKKEGFSQSEIQEAKEHIKNNAKKLFADDNRYLEVPSMIENEMPINLMAKDKSDEQLAKEFLERQEHRRADSIYREIDDIKKTMGRIKWDFENKWSPANLKRLEKTLERIQKNVVKQKKESFKIESMTYDLNTKEGEAKVRELFAYTKTNAEQKELFELILPIARNLGVRVRHALNDIDGKHIAGRYTYKENMARVKHNGNIKNELKGQVLLHELIHSVTSRAIHAYENNAKEILSPRQINAIKNIKDIYKQIKETGGLGLEMYKGYNLGGDYGLKNAHELIAELSNPSFVEKLKKINVFEKLIDNIVKLFVGAKEMLGLKRTNAYEKLREQVVEIVQNYKPNFARDYEANFKRYIKSESEELESLSKPDSLASASNSIESAVKTQEMGDIAHEAPNIAKTDDEIIPQIQRKFNFDETKAKDLYEWHKESHAITKDKNGLPKVFYHGTGDNYGFEIFKPNDIDGTPAIYFSTSKKVATSYAQTGYTKEGIYECFLNIKKPLVIDFKGKNYNGLEYEKLLKEALSNGNDGVIIKNVYDDTGGYYDKQGNFKDIGKADTLIVFDSNQIKAVENKGLKGENGKREYFNESSPNIYQSNSHLGAGLLSGSVSGFQTDEQGNLSFNPQNFLLGLAGGAVGSKAIAQGFKALKSNPELKAKVTQELANTLSKGWESATQKYPILSTLEPRYIAKNEKTRTIQAKLILRDIEKESKALDFAKIKTINAVDRYAQTQTFKSLSKDKQQAILSLKDIIPEPMPKEISLKDFESLRTHFENKTDKKARVAYLKLFDSTKQKPDIVLQVRKNGELRKEYIKAFQHKESKDLYYLAITKGKREITGIPTTQIKKVINEIKNCESIESARALEKIAYPAEPIKNLNSQLSDTIIPQLHKKR